MKRVLSMIFVLCSLPALLIAQLGIYQHGTVVRMHMGNCMLTQQRFSDSWRHSEARPP
jgi:hypothetical protein